MTLSEIKDRVWERLEEDATTPLRYPDAVVTEYIYDGARFYIARTGCQTTTVTVTQIAHTMLYDLPCDCIQVERVLWNSSGTYYPLAPTLPRELDGSVYGWQRMTDTRARQYFLLGLDRIALWPEITTGTQSYIVHYQQDVDTTLASVPVEDHEALVSYVIGRCLLSEAKVKDGAIEYGRYKEVVAKAARRMASVDRLWAMT